MHQSRKSLSFLGGLENSYEMFRKVIRIHHWVIWGFRPSLQVIYLRRSIHRTSWRTWKCSKTRGSVCSSADAVMVECCWRLGRKKMVLQLLERGDEILTSSTWVLNLSYQTYLNFMFQIHADMFASLTDRQLMKNMKPRCFTRMFFVAANYLDVSKNGGTPKWMVYNGKPY